MCESPNWRCHATDGGKSNGLAVAQCIAPAPSGYTAFCKSSPSQMHSHMLARIAVDHRALCMRCPGGCRMMCPSSPSLTPPCGPCQPHRRQQHSPLQALQPSPKVYSRDPFSMQSRPPSLSLWAQQFVCQCKACRSVICLCAHIWAETLGPSICTVLCVGRAEDCAGHAVLSVLCAELCAETGAPSQAPPTEESPWQPRKAKPGTVAAHIKGRAPGPIEVSLLLRPLAVQPLTLPDLCECIVNVRSA